MGRLSAAWRCTLAAERRFDALGAASRRLGGRALRGATRLGKAATQPSFLPDVVNDHQHDERHAGGDQADLKRAQRAPTLAAFAAALPPEGEQFAPRGG